MAEPKPSKKTLLRRRASDLTRLESWKAIANYLNRSVRTVRRWEATEDLPVHRHRHTKGFSVFAYRSELDAWRHGHPPDSAQSAHEPTTERQSDRTMLRLLPHAAVLLGMIVGGVILAQSFTPDRLPMNDPGLNGDGSPRLAVSAAPDELLVLDISELENTAYWPKSVSRVVLLPVLTAWVDGQSAAVLHEIGKVNATLREFPDETRSYLVQLLLDFALSLGRIDDAREILATVEDDDRRYELKTNILFALGDKEGMRVHLENGTDFKNEITPLFMAMAGLDDEASALNAVLQSPVSRPGRTKLIDAMAAMGAGDQGRARELLQAAVAELEVSDQAYFFVALDMLSGINRSEGRLNDAVSILENTMLQRDYAAANNSGLFWTMCQRNLATLYRDAGRTDDALRLENALREQLELSDITFPLAQSLDAV